MLDHIFGYLKGKRGDIIFGRKFGNSDHIVRLEAEAVATKEAPLTPREQVASREEHIDEVAFNLVWF